MASAHMIEAIGRLDRAVDRLEREWANRPPSPPPASSHPSTPAIDVPAARAALRSLDDLIADLTGKTDG